MTKTYSKKMGKQSNILYTVISAVLISAVFLSAISLLYTNATEEAYEMLHLQTKQIKDDLILQIKSDRENLVTMANFAAKLYANGEGFDILFNAFKPIGLFSEIGILLPDNTLVTRAGSIDASEGLSFEAELAKGEYITGRVKDSTYSEKEIVRNAVPIKLEEETIGILYGIIYDKTISEKYINMAKELNAQLFVYDVESGKYIVDTISADSPGQITDLKGREYKEGYSYEKMVNSEKGFTSFKSIFTGETMFLHYSSIEDFGWKIMLGRYESQVFEEIHDILKLFLLTIAVMLGIIVIYILLISKKEKEKAIVIGKASTIRKLLLEINQHHGNVAEALRKIQQLAQSRSAYFVDMDGEDYDVMSPSFNGNLIQGEEKKYFIGELFRYAAELHNLNRATVGLMSIRPDKHLYRTNENFCEFLSEHKIEEITFATITDKHSHISILGTINPKKSRITRELLADIAVCFSIAVYNKKHLKKTIVAATTDSLTGVMNRVSYKKDIMKIDERKPEKFSCIYVDVNELHLRNNKYGHAAGDEMLIFIASLLREVFFGHKIYRMGGDEFLVFVENNTQDYVKDCIDTFISRLKEKEYHVAIGMSYRNQSTNCEELVREAEIRMYDAKAQYYQNKENISVSSDKNKKYIQIKTGIREIDAMISILKDHYNGIYRVSLETDNAHRILMPSYLGYNEDEKNFSKLFVKYVEEIVHPDFHRPVSNFLNYNVVKRQLSEGITPRITYKKTNGETVILSVYKLGSEEQINETLWVFAKD